LYTLSDICHSSGWPPHCGLAFWFRLTMLARAALGKVTSLEASTFGHSPGVWNQASASGHAKPVPIVDKRWVV